MKNIISKGIWYHGSDKVFSILNAGSTITQWRELAEAFSHQPSQLSYGDDGIIIHNGVKDGYLYTIDEEIDINKDIYPHPDTTMDADIEFITKRALKVKRIKALNNYS